ncbi:hypothetical protein [Nonomuraea sp. NPDC049709]|uniref:hypothetical protein n=1 Tax=Nonomuraea sp. NPDC049709 TaxID=3154736 RepID=UPI003449826B
MWRGRPEEGRPRPACRARVTRCWTLCPRGPGTACSPHGQAFDHRTHVLLA